MAAQAQQSPHLHLAELTAAQFIDIWKHFDADGQCVSTSLMNVELSGHLKKESSCEKVVLIMHVFIDRITPFSSDSF